MTAKIIDFGNAAKFKMFKDWSNFITTAISIALEDEHLPADAMAIGLATLQVAARGLVIAGLDSKARAGGNSLAELFELWLDHFKAGGEFNAEDWAQRFEKED